MSEIRGLYLVYFDLQCRMSFIVQSLFSKGLLLQSARKCYFYWDRILFSKTSTLHVFNVLEVFFIFLPKSFTYMDGLNNNQLNIYNAKGFLEHH